MVMYLICEAMQNIGVDTLLPTYCNLIFSATSAKSEGKRAYEIIHWVMLQGGTCCTYVDIKIQISGAYICFSLRGASCRIAFRWSEYRDTMNHQAGSLPFALITEILLQWFTCMCWRKAAEITQHSQSCLHTNGCTTNEMLFSLSLILSAGTLAGTAELQHSMR